MVEQPFNRYVYIIVEPSFNCQALITKFVVLTQSYYPDNIFESGGSLQPALALY